MGKWQVFNIGGTLIHEETGGTGFSYTFSENTGLMTKQFKVVYTDDAGCSGNTTLSQAKCECTSEYLTNSEIISGSCFCEGFKYRAWLYDKCKPLTELTSTTETFVFDTSYTGATGNTLTMNPSLSYDGRLYLASVELNSPNCTIVPVNVVLSGDTITNSPLNFTAGFNNISATIGDYSYTNIGSTQQVSITPNSEKVLNDKVRYCNESASFVTAPNVSITFPTTFEANVSIGGVVSSRTYTWNSGKNAWIGPSKTGDPYAVDSHIRLSYSARVVSGTLKITIVVNETDA